MTVFILIIFAAVAAACFIMVSRLDRLNNSTNSCGFHIALDDISAAASLCERLEPVSAKYPYIQFSFYTGSSRDIKDLCQSGKIDIGIISCEPSGDKLHYISVQLKTKKTVLTEYNIAVEPIGSQDKDFYIIFCPERFDDIKNEILKAIEK